MNITLIFNDYKNNLHHYEHDELMRISNFYANLINDMKFLNNDTKNIEIDLSMFSSKSYNKLMQNFNSMSHIKYNFEQYNYHIETLNNAGALGFEQMMSPRFNRDYIYQTTINKMFSAKL